MILIPAFAIQGTADFSNIKSELQALQSTIAGLRIPPIKTQVETPNLANFFKAMDQAEARTIKIKPQVDTSMMGGLNSFLSGQKGQFQKAGQELGQVMTMGMTQQFGVMGGAASSFAMALGPVGIAAGAGALAVGALGAAAVSAASQWEDMATSIGRTTGLDGSQLESMMNSLQKLRMEMGISRDAARGLVESAGSIGVGQNKFAAGDMEGYKNEILDFARSTAMLQGAWGMSADATATGIGKMGSVTLGAWNAQRKAMGEQEMSWSEYAESVGGKVDVLANTMGSTEEEIVTAMRNSSAAVASFAPSEDTYEKWLALSSFLIDTGSSAGEAGTQIERMAKGAKQHGAELGAILGMDKAGFSEALQADFVGTYQQIAETLATMPESERPDMIKLLGIEGSGAMDKMIADVKSGVNKLNTAIELDPTNVTEGWDKVADNASKAFDRIGEAAKVSLEKIGGIMLPIVTDIANAIADAWQTGNEWGSAAFGNIKENVANADKKIAETGSLIEWGKALLGIDEEVTPAVADAAAEGMETGLTEGAEKGAKDAAEAVKTELKSAAIEASDAYLENIKNFKGSSELAPYIAGMGLSDAAAMAAYNSQNTKANQLLKQSSFSLFGDQYARQLMKGGSGEYVNILGPDFYKGSLKAGEDAAEDIAKAHYDNMKDSIMDSATFMKTRYGQMSDELGNIMADDIFEDMEKAQLEVYDKLLDLYKQDMPIEFKAANLDDLQQKIKDAIKGPWDAKVELSTDPVLAAQFIDKNFALYSRMVGSGISPMRASETEYFEYKQGLEEKGETDILSVLGTVEEVVDSGNYQTKQGALLLTESLAYLRQAAPELANMAGFMDRLEMADIDLKNQRTADAGTIYKDGKAPDAYNVLVDVASSIKHGFVSQMKEGSPQKPTDLNALKDGIWETSSSSEKAATNTDSISKTSDDISEKIDTLESSADGTNDSLSQVVNGLKIIAEGVVATVEAIGTAAGSITAAIAGISINITNVSNSYGSSSGSASWAASYGMGTTWGTAKVGASTPSKSALKNAITKYATGGFANQATIAMFGEAGEEAFVPISDRQAGLDMLPKVAAKLGVPMFAKGGMLVKMGSGLSGWGGSSGAAGANLGENVIKLTNNLGECAGACELTQRAMEEEGIAISKVVAQQNAAIDSGDYLSDSALDTNEFFTYIGQSGETFFNEISASSDLVVSANTQLAKTVGSLDSKHLGYNADKEEFYYVPDQGISDRDLQMGRFPKDAEYKAIVAEIERMNKQLVDAKANYLACTDIATDFTRVMMSQDFQRSMYQGDFIGSKSAYQAWVDGGRVGNVGYSAHAEIAASFQADNAARLFREKGDISGIVAASAFGSSATSSSSILLKAIAKSTDDTAENTKESTKQLNSIKTTWDELDNIIKSEASGGSSDILAGSASGTKALTWMLDEFDSYIASTESGLSSCIQSLSDFAIMQEGVLAGSLFNAAYIGPDDRNGPNYFDTFSLEGPYLEEAARRGLIPNGNLATQAAKNAEADAVKKGVDSSRLADSAANTEEGVNAVDKNTKGLKEDIRQIGNGMSDLVGGMGGSGGGGGGWGGVSQYSGMGGWIGTWGTMSGMNGGAYYGSTASGAYSASGGSSGWGGAASSGVSGGFGGSNGWGSVQWAEGGFADRPTYGLFGEAGREAFVPISDRAAGLRILPRVMAELGVRSFAQGGFVGAGGAAGSFSSGGPAVVTTVHVHGDISSDVKLAEVLKRHDKKLIQDLSAAMQRAKRR